MSYIWGGKETQYFFELSPDLILDTCSEHGFDVTGRCLPLNSMENRVYEIEIENFQDFNLNNNAIIPKFYRPGRWNENQIKQEHEFLFDLKENDLSVIAPLKLNGESLFKLESKGLFYTFFPKKGGRAPDEMKDEQLEILGRTLARLHNIGEMKKAPDRITISPQSFGLENLNFLLEQNILPLHLESTYKTLVEEIVNEITPLFEGIKNYRIHGDCHLGNIISRESEGLFLIDFDDMLTGPAIQDLWLVNPGYDEYAKANQEKLLEAYRTMRDFDSRELKLIEPLRTLRYIHFSAWMAKRWDDPAFKTAFPHFEDSTYWDVQINDLRQQKIKIQQFSNNAFQF